MTTVKFTNDIPLCPFCDQPTRRVYKGSSKTLMYFQPVYDKNGINMNPDRNTVTSLYLCLDCQKYYEIEGNDVDGYSYKDTKGE